MGSIQAAKVLMSHLPEITDGAYKTATEIAIENLFQDALRWYHYRKLGEEELTPAEYLGLTPEQYDYWVFGIKG